MFLLIKALISFIRAPPSRSDYFPNIPPLNIILWGFRLHPMNFGGCGDIKIQSIADRV